MTVHGSTACECFVWLAVFKPADDACSWFSRKWVLCLTAFSCPLKITLLGPPVGEWLLCLAASQAYWQCLSWTHQRASSYCALLYFKPANNFCHWLSSLWVAAISCYLSSLLLIFVLGTLESESSASPLFKTADDSSLWVSRMWVAVVPYCILSADNVCFWLSVCEWLCCTVFYLKPTADEYSWLSRMWVDTVSCYMSSMLMILFFAIQDVSGCHIPCYIS